TRRDHAGGRASLPPGGGPAPRRSAGIPAGPPDRLHGVAAAHDPVHRLDQAFLARRIQPALRLRPPGGTPALTVTPPSRPPSAAPAGAAGAVRHGHRAPRARLPRCRCGSRRARAGTRVTAWTAGARGRPWATVPAPR